MTNNESKSGLARQVTIDNVIYYHMPILIAIKYAGKISSGFFIPLSESKRVRIQLEDGDIADKMEKYREKGLESILLAEDDYYAFVKKIKHGLITLFLNDSDEEPKLLNLEQMLRLMRKVTKYIGLSEDTIIISENIARKVLNQIKTVSVISEPLRTFQRENQNEFLKNLMVCYAAIGLIDALEWTSPSIKEKIAQACFFCDITLSSDDYTEMILMSNDPDRFSKSILNHPIAAANLAAKTHNAVGNEVTLAIRQHHELPDGSGYPKGIKGLSINQLSAIHIVARSYIDALIDSDFAYGDRRKFIQNMLQKFNYPNFAQPCKALYLIMGLEPEKQEDDY